MRRALMLVCALTIAAPAWAEWQSTAGVAAWYDGDLPTSSFRIAPTFALDSPRGVLVGGAMMSGSEMQSPFRGARLASGYVLDPIVRLPLEVRFSIADRDDPAQANRGLVRAI